MVYHRIVFNVQFNRFIRKIGFANYPSDFKGVIAEHFGPGLVQNAIYKRVCAIKFVKVSQVEDGGDVVLSETFGVYHQSLHKLSKHNLETEALGIDDRQTQR